MLAFILLNFQLWILWDLIVNLKLTLLICTCWEGGWDEEEYCYPFIFLLVKFALILLVATTSVEMIFQKKNYEECLRNRMEDNLINNCLVTYIKRDVSNNIDSKTIIRIIVKGINLIIGFFCSFYFSYCFNYNC